MVNACTRVAEIRCTVGDVCFAVCAVEPRNTVTRVRVDAVDACGGVLAWIGCTVVDIYCAVISRKSGIAVASILGDGRAQQTFAVFMTIGS